MSDDQCYYEKPIHTEPKDSEKSQLCLLDVTDKVNTIQQDNEKSSANFDTKRDPDAMSQPSTNDRSISYAGTKRDPDAMSLPSTKDRSLSHADVQRDPDALKIPSNRHDVPQIKYSSSANGDSSLPELSLIHSSAGNDANGAYKPARGGDNLPGAHVHGDPNGNYPGPIDTPAIPPARSLHNPEANPDSRPAGSTESALGGAAAEDANKDLRIYHDKSAQPLSNRSVIDDTRNSAAIGDSREGKLGIRYSDMPQKGALEEKAVNPSTPQDSSSEHQDIQKYLKDVTSPSEKERLQAAVKEDAADIAELLGKDGKLSKYDKDAILKAYDRAKSMGAEKELVESVNSALEKAGSPIRMIHDAPSGGILNSLTESTRLMFANTKTGEIVSSMKFSPMPYINPVRSDYDPYKVRPTNWRK